MYHGTAVVRALSYVPVVVASAKMAEERARSADIEIPQKLAPMIRETLPESSGQHRFQESEYEK